MVYLSLIELYLLQLVSGGELYDGVIMWNFT